MGDPFDLLLRHPGGETPIHVGAGVLETRHDAIARRLQGRTTFLVSSAPVLALHGDALARLAEAAARWVVLEVPDGEAAKVPDVAVRLWRDMLAAGGKRDSRVIAFGGGSVGDLAGFVAGAFLRGVECLQLPTTLLAQVDAAIGGKTAVNLPEAKNSVGLFHHPAAVVADTRLLATLPASEIRSGLMEVVKMGFLLAPDLFELLERDLEALLAADPERLAPVVAAAARAKIGVVERDPGEAGPRALLNFGHTLGHALEAVLGYRRLRHGEAVGHGMRFALRLAARRGLAPDAAARLTALLDRCRLPPLPADVTADELLAAMRRDKKAREEGLVWVLPTDVGHGETVAGVDEAEVRSELAAYLAAPRRERPG